MLVRASLVGISRFRMSNGYLKKFFTVIVLSFFVLLFGSKCQRSPAVPATPDDLKTMLRVLPADARIECELVLGGYVTKVPTATRSFMTAAINLPSRKWILEGDSLTVYRPQGNFIDNATLTKRISEELGAVFGGWFTQDLTAYIQLHDGLVSDETKERYRSGGMTIDWDEPQAAFYYLEFEASPWQVQGIGELGQFHVIFLGRFISAEEAVGPGGHPLHRPLGAIDAVLSSATPCVMEQAFADLSEAYFNVFDFYLEREMTTVKAGVRQRLDEAGNTVASQDQSYFYGIRVNVDLRERE